MIYKNKNFYDKILSKNLNLNAIGYGYSREKPLFFNIKDKKVSAIICSTNRYGSEKDPQIIDIKCHHNLLNNRNISLPPNNKLKVNCPSFCKEDLKAKLYGINRHTQWSSVCLAAIHKGLIKNNEGGDFILSIKDKSIEFIGLLKNGIRSNNYEGESAISFIVHKNNEKCPIQIHKNPKRHFDQSFIERTYTYYRKPANLTDVYNKMNKKKAENNNKNNNQKKINGKNQTVTNSTKTKKNTTKTKKDEKKDNKEMKKKAKEKEIRKLIEKCKN